MSSDASPISRRQFLGSATLAFIGGLAGCSGQPSESDEATSTQVPSSTETGPHSPTSTAPPTSVVKTPRSIPSSDPTSTPTSTPSKSLSPPFVSVSGTTNYGIELTGSPVMGKQDTSVPIDIYYWSDYQCSYCKQFEAKYLPDLIRNEIRNGTARLIILQYPNYGPHSWTAGVMMKCLWRVVKDSNPDAFWRWHHTVFKHQGLAEGEWSSRESLLDYARNSQGINAQTVDQCMRRNRTQLEADIRQERQRGRKEGIANTPGFVVYHPATNRHVTLHGAQPYSRFHTQIQTLLNK